MVKVLSHDEQSRIHGGEPLVLMEGRGNKEKTIAQLKGGMAFHKVRKMEYEDNGEWQQLVILKQNLLKNLELEKGEARRRR